jgi:hypothetical protein
MRPPLPTIRASRACVAALVLTTVATAAHAQRASSPNPTTDPAGFVASAKPAVLTPKDLRALRWIEGTWRGSGGSQKPFYERYAFVDDSTLRMESFADSTLARVSETTFYELRGGRFANRSVRARWVAASLKDRAITFVPDVGVRNLFVWRPSKRDVWYADIALLPPPDNSRPAPPPRTYELVRLPRA